MATFLLYATSTLIAKTLYNATRIATVVTDVFKKWWYGSSCYKKCAQNCLLTSWILLTFTYGNFVIALIHGQKAACSDSNKKIDVSILYEQRNRRPVKELRHLQTLVQQLRQREVDDDCIQMSLVIAGPEPDIVMPLNCDDSCFIKVQQEFQTRVSNAISRNEYVGFRIFSVCKIDLLTEIFLDGRSGIEIVAKPFQCRVSEHFFSYFFNAIRNLLHCAVNHMYRSVNPWKVNSALRMMYLVD